MEPLEWEGEASDTTLHQIDFHEDISLAVVSEDVDLPFGTDSLLGFPSKDYTFDFQQEIGYGLNDDINGADSAASGLERLNLGNGKEDTNIHGSHSTSIIDDVNRDPIAFLEAAIEADKPKIKTSPEWERMMETIEEDHQSTEPILLETTDTSTYQEVREVSLEENSESIEHQANHLSLNDDADAVVSSPVNVLSGAEVSRTTEETENVNSYITLIDEGEDSEPSKSQEDQEGKQKSSEHEDTRNNTFRVLQPICSRFFEYREDPEALYSLLRSLKEKIEILNPGGLQACLDYILFPLSMALDSIVACRRSSLERSDEDKFINVYDSAGNLDSMQQSQEKRLAVAIPAMSFDRTAEIAVETVLCLLERCHCEREEQLVGILERLHSLLSVPRDKLSEEVRLGTLLISCAALEGILRNCYHETVVSIIEALRNEVTAPLVGVFSSTLLKSFSSEQEVGSAGNKDIKLHSVRALRLFIDLISSAEALSFFLPGLMTGLASILAPECSRSNASQKNRTSRSTICEALRAIDLLLIYTLGDNTMHGIFNVEENVQEPESRVTYESHSKSCALGTQSALEELKALQFVMQQDKIMKVENYTSALEANTKSFERDVKNRDVLVSGDDSRKELRVNRSEIWVRESSEKVCGFLEIILPSLSRNHNSPEVKIALLQNIIFAFAEDEWPQVQQAARSELTSCSHLPIAGMDTVGQESNAISKRAGACINRLVEAVEPCILTWIEELPQALRNGDTIGRLNAMKISTCLQVLDVNHLVNILFPNFSAKYSIVEALSDAIALDSEMASLLIFSGAQSTLLLTEPRISRLNSSIDLNIIDPKDDDNSKIIDPTKHLACLKEKETSHSQKPNDNEDVPEFDMLLPRMPGALKYISSIKTWNAVAQVFRGLGVATYVHYQKNDIESSPRLLHAIIHALMEYFEEKVDFGLGQNNRIGCSHWRKEQAVGASCTSLKLEKFEDESFHPWQLSASQSIIVLGEIIFGAFQCNVSKSPIDFPDGKDQCLGEDCVLDVEFQSRQTCRNALKEAKDKILNPVCLKKLVYEILETVIDKRILELQTTSRILENTSVPQSYATSHHGGKGLNLSTASTFATFTSAEDMVSSRSQEKGSNIILQKTILELVGTCARVVGEDFVKDGKFMRLALLPVLEKLADPAAPVASAAKAAIFSICKFCGYKRSGLRQLITDNTDYIIDGMCQRLRLPELYPEAPRLFASLLCQSGVAPALIPLMNEPARQALQGVSIISRKKKPEHMMPFLLCLREISKGARIVTAETCSQIKAIGLDIQSRKQTILEKYGPKHVMHEDEVCATNEVNIEKISNFFSQRENGIDFKDQEELREYKAKKFEERCQVDVAQNEFDEIHKVKMLSVSAGSLCQSVIDCGAALIVSSSLANAVQAIQTCQEALIGLRNASLSSDIFNKNIKSFIKCRGDTVETPSNLQDIPLLPSVHLVWQPLLSALDDWRVPLVENALEMLVDLSILAGDFTAQRFRKDAVPRIQALLKHGASKKRLLAPGQDDLTAPAAIQRVQNAVISCIHKLAVGEGEASLVLQPPVAGTLMSSVSNAMGEIQAAAYKNAAAEAFVALAAIDSDRAFAVIVAALRAHGLSPSSSMEACCAYLDEEMWNGLPLDFMSLHDVCPVLSVSEDLLPRGLCCCSEARLRAIALRITEAPVKWHEKIEFLLEHC